MLNANVYIFKTIINVHIFIENMTGFHAVHSHLCNEVCACVIYVYDPPTHNSL